MTGRDATPPLHRTPCGPGGHGLPHQPDERGYCAGCTGLFDVGREATPNEVIIDGREYVTKDWHGLRAILRDVYPADIFTGASGDLGPRLVALLREIDAVTPPARETT